MSGVNEETDPEFLRYAAHETRRADRARWRECNPIDATGHLLPRASGSHLAYPESATYPGAWRFGPEDRRYVGEGRY